MANDYCLQQADIDLLRQAGMSEPDIDHSTAVAN